jgi:hypothetical protein
MALDHSSSHISILPCPDRVLRVRDDNESRPDRAVGFRCAVDEAPNVPVMKQGLVAVIRKAAETVEKNE